MYDAASAYTAVPDTDGKITSSSSFPINRGVLQGDITSPLYFILALELILQKHDWRVDKEGISFADVLLHTLGYADDVAIIEYGDEADGCLTTFRKGDCNQEGLEGKC